MEKENHQLGLTAWLFHLSKATCRLKFSGANHYKEFCKASRLGNELLMFEMRWLDPLTASLSIWGDSPQHFSLLIANNSPRHCSSRWVDGSDGASLTLLIFGLLVSCEESPTAQLGSFLKAPQPCMPGSCSDNSCGAAAAAWGLKKDEEGQSWAPLVALLLFAPLEQLTITEGQGHNRPTFGPEMVQLVLTQHAIHLAELWAAEGQELPNLIHHCSSAVRFVLVGAAAFPAQILPRTLQSLNESRVNLLLCTAIKHCP